MDYKINADFVTRVTKHLDLSKGKTFTQDELIQLIKDEAGILGDKVVTQEIVTNKADVAKMLGGTLKTTVDAREEALNFFASLKVLGGSK